MKLLVYIVVEQHFQKAGVSRENVQQMFYPTGDDVKKNKQARKTFSQSLKALNDLNKGEPVIEIFEQQGIPCLKVNVKCDTVNFLEMIEQGVLNKALEIYKAPFLDSVNIQNEADPFNAWIIEKRDLFANELFRIATRAIKRAYISRQYDLIPSYLDKLNLALQSTFSTLGQEDIDMQLLCEQIYAILTDTHPSLITEFVRLADENGIIFSEDPTSTLKHVSLPKLLKGNELLIGREKIQEEIMLEVSKGNNRIVTLHGFTGSGKTALVKVIAENLYINGTFNQGIYYIDIALLAQEIGLLQRLAGLLNLPSSQNLKMNIFNILRYKKVLFVLDNVMESSGIEKFLVDFCSECPSIRLLLVSTEILKLGGLEKHVYLKGLSIPNESTPYGEYDKYPSIKLFKASIPSTVNEFLINETNVSDLLQLCQLTGGNPLALKLVAGLLDINSLREVIADLSQEVELLASITQIWQRVWSQLTNHEQLLLLAMSVFRGGASRKALEYITKQLELEVETTTTLRKFFAKCLLENKEAGRFDLHPLIRNYCLLEAANDIFFINQVKKAHAHYFAHVFGQVDELNKSQEWHLDLEADLFNVRMAVEFLEDGALLSKIALTLKAALMKLGYLQDRKSFTLKALTNIETLDTTEIARLNNLLASTYIALEELKAAENQLEKALVNNSQNKTFAETKTLLGTIYYKQGQFEKSEENLKEAFTVYELLNHKLEASRVLNHIGTLYFEKNIFSQAIYWFEEALKYQKEEKAKEDKARTVNNLGMAYLASNEFSKALTYLEQAEVLKKQGNDKRGLSITQGNLAQILWLTGQYHKAKIIQQDILVYRKKIGDNVDQAKALNNLAMTLQCLGEYDEARRLLEEARVILQVVDPNPVLCKTYYNLSIVLCDLGFKKDAEHYAKIALELAVKNSWETDTAYAYLFLANSLYVKQDQLDVNQNRVYYYSLAVDKFQELENLVGLATSLNAFAKFSYEKNYFELAVEKASKALNIANDLNLVPQKRLALITSSKAHNSLGDNQLSKKHFKLALEIDQQLNLPYLDDDLQLL